MAKNQQITTEAGLRRLIQQNRKLLQQETELLKEQNARLREQNSRLKTLSDDLEERGVLGDDPVLPLPGDRHSPPG